MKNNILFSSRELEVTYGEDYFHDPILFDGKTWLWRVRIDFGAWAYRAISNAKLNNALTPELSAKWDVIRKYLRDTYGSQCDEIPTMAKKPVQLPPIPSEWFSLTFCAHMGLTSNPPWPTFEADRARFCTEPADRTGPADVATVTVTPAMPATTAEVVKAATTKTETMTKTTTMTSTATDLFTATDQPMPSPAAAV